MEIRKIIYIKIIRINLLKIKKTEVDDSHGKMSSNKKVKWENDYINDINDFE